MAVKAAHFAPRHWTLAHPPPHGTHLPGALAAVSLGALDGFAHVPATSTEFLDAPPEAFVRVLALSQAGDGLVAELDDFEWGRGWGEEDVGGGGGVEERRLGDGGDVGEVQVVEIWRCPALGRDFFLGLFLGVGWR